jgi:ring-1,2-phenylacetyl-CoA epoxidase subunit PaaE
MTGLHFHPLRVRAVRADTDDAMVVTFDVPGRAGDTFRFQPGQYLTLRQPGQDLRRSYSICARPARRCAWACGACPAGAFSTWLHQTLKAGDTLEVMEPQGRFGAAVASRRAAATCCASPAAAASRRSCRSSRPCWRSEPAAASRCCTATAAASTMFKEELEDLKNRHLTRLALHPVFSREQVDSPLNMGRLDRDKIGVFLRLIGPGLGRPRLRLRPACVERRGRGRAARRHAGRAHPHRTLRRAAKRPPTPRCMRRSRATPPTRASPWCATA